MSGAAFAKTVPTGWRNRVCVPCGCTKSGEQPLSAWDVTYQELSLHGDMLIQGTSVHISQHRGCFPGLCSLARTTSVPLCLWPASHPGLLICWSRSEEANHIFAASSLAQSEVVWMYLNIEKKDSRAFRAQQPIKLAGLRLAREYAEACIAFDCFKFPGPTNRCPFTTGFTGVKPQHKARARLEHKFLGP